MPGNNPNRTQWAAVVILGLAITSATVLTAMGIFTKTEMLPLLGGVVVVAHRMLDSAIKRGLAQTLSKTVLSAG